MDLHPYDGVERPFRHTDPLTGFGPEAVALVLRLPGPLTGEVLYDLSFLSGGMGVLDHLAVFIPADPELCSKVVVGLAAWALEEAATDPPWAEELGWLLAWAEEPIPLRPAAVQFIEQHRRGFQSECRPGDRILFQYGSNVNDWVALWGDDTRLNNLGYSQG